ncbi:MAG: VCBS repeat-containing protein [Planctomycetes bacterium]|nr:VCBS repeat-containing protein [Planctomycetota bacterium]
MRVLQRSWSMLIGTIGLLVPFGLHGQCPPFEDRVTVLPHALAVRSLTVGDLNGDGRDDIVLATPNEGIVVLLAEVGGSFENVGQWFVQSSQIELGDLDGDGDLDAIALGGAGTLTVLLGDGVGGFAPVGSYDTLQTAAYGVSSANIVVADFDGDSNLDVAVGSYGDATGAGADGLISMFFGDGTGTLAPAVGVPAGPYPVSIAAGDLDLDGDLDLVASGDELVVMLGDGTGTFAPPVTYGPPTLPGLIVIAELNGDVLPDVVHARDGTLDILTGAGGGTLAVAGSYPTLGSVGTVVAVDLDGDTARELVLGSSSSDASTVLLNDGVGNFTSTEPIFTGESSEHLAAGDFDGDGWVDLATPIAAILGDGAVTFDSGVAVTPIARATTVADLDADGLLDLVYLRDGEIEIRWSDPLGGSSGSDFYDVSQLAPSGSSPGWITAGDVDADGDLDLVFQEPFADYSFGVLQGDGLGAFVSNGFTATGRITELRAQDLDADGDADVVIFDGIARRVEIWEANAGSFTWAGSVDLPGAKGIDLGDFDEDGLVDLATASGTLGARWLRATAIGEYEPPVEIGLSGYQRSVLAADLNGDAHLDLVVGQNDAVSVLLGSGLGDFTFVSVAPIEFPFVHSMVCGDFDQDGAMDVLASSLLYRVQLLLGDGSGSLDASDALSLGWGSHRMHVADLDDDGAPDVATPTCVLYNDCPPMDFVRGDCNADGVTDIGDVVALLAGLFVAGTPPPACGDACDPNDDGAGDVSDAIFLLANLFTLGPPIPAPTTCGPDATTDALGCDQFSSCP